MDVLNNPNTEHDYYDYHNPARVFERKVKALYAKAEREFFHGRGSPWEYEEQLRKIDEYVKIWTKRASA
jgi:hypothetical protein